MSVSGFTNSYIRQLMSNEPGIKKYYDYDADVDVVDIYRVDSSASDGTACLKHRLEYITISGDKVIRKEDWINSTWSSAWDI